MDDIFKSLCEMKWNFEEFKINSTHNNFVTYGSNNPMFGLKGENHPSSKWHKSEATKEYYDEKRIKVLEGWMNNEERRKQYSEKMKERWNTGKLNAEKSRKNGQHGLKGKDIHNTIDIEYKGVLYYGWRELQDKTKVTKHLYKKYYLNGLDPEPRIGSDGPNPNKQNNFFEKEVSE